MNNKVIFSAILVTFAVTPAILNAQSASPAPSSGGTSSSASGAATASPGTGDTTSSATGAQSAPGTGDTSTSATSGSVTAPGTGDGATSANPAQSPGAPSTGDSTSSASPATVPPANNGGGSTSGGPVYSGSGGGSRVNMDGYLLPTPTVNTNSCELYVGSYLKRGGNNSVAEVTKLQKFLIKFEKADVIVNGIFDEKTENAVKAFQTKYSSVILTPWGASIPSGMVYITTQKQINNLACSQPLTINTAELTIIDNFRKARTNANGISAPVASPSIPAVEQTASPSPVDESISPEKTNEPSENTDEFGSADQESNTASASNPSAVRRFWDFLKNLF